MLGHAVKDSTALRALWRCPVPSGPFHTTSRRSAIPKPFPPTSVSYRRENYNTKNPDYRWVDRALGSKKGPSRDGDITSSNYTSKKDVIRLLEEEILEMADNYQLARKIHQWGLRGDAMKAILTTNDPEHPQKDGSPDGVMKGLLQLWKAEAITSLQTSTTSPSSAAFDMDNAMNAIEAEGVDCVKRLTMNSFLRWLEAQLKVQPLGARLLARTQNLLSLVDLRFPSLQYEAARSIVRQIHLHVGPTNSGKTHGALVALCKADTGLYAGPLRLLAHEVWERIRSGTASPGVPARPCNLMTGEEIKMDEGGMAGLSACTVEMLNYNTLIDVAVVDEIQMIGDPQRGSAWTTAVLGLPAKELHLCGESSVIPLIEKMAKACGDVLHVHNYKRLTPLKLGPSLGGNLKEIKKGDCLVAFSRSEIFNLKNQIETLTPFKCALAYGALPPETKSEQARRFNDPNNDVSVMVASDAIGMGLNLKIKRVIFHKVDKWNGTEIVPISTSQLKQIAGRAGRYGTSDEDAAGGLATTLDDEDLGVLKAALDAPLKPITRAGITPTSHALASLTTMLPGKKKQEHHQKGRDRDLMTLYSDMNLLSQIDSRIYFAGSNEQQMKVGPLLEELVSAFRDMTIADREIFAIAPANFRDERLVALLSNMVNYYARGELIKFEMVDCLDMLPTLKSVENISKPFNQQMEGVSTQERSGKLAEYLRTRGKRFNIDNLMILESLHRGLTLYLWLSYRRPVNFCYRADVEDYSRRTENAIDFCLEAVKAARVMRLAERGDDRESGTRKPWSKSTYKGKQPSRFGRSQEKPRGPGNDMFNQENDARRSAREASL
jgi:ATP-dependent RNA helicase SUPV3L1/SUV3